VSAWFLGLLDFLEGKYPSSRARCEESLRLVQEIDAWPWLGSEVWLAAALAAVQGRHGVALRLFAAGARMGERWAHHGSEPIMRAALGPMLEASRAAIGEDERVAAETEGRAMSAEQAVAYALRELER
jgi:hypothetical protein